MDQERGSTGLRRTDAQTWLVMEEGLSGPYCVRLESALSGSVSIEEGDWVVLVDRDNALERLGHVCRVRTGLENTSIYFDREHTFKEAVALPDLGLLTPEQKVARVRPEDVAAALARDGLTSLDNVPLIADANYVRELLELATRDDLLGPAGGPEELIVDMSVRDRYLVGKLAPRRPGEVEGVQVEPASAADEVETAVDEAREAPLHEPGAEFNRAGGRVEPEDDALDEIDTTNNQSLVPSSMGLTFCVGPDVGEISVTARWGRYERVPNDEHGYTKPRRNRKTGEQEEAKVKVWRRVPCGGTAVLPMADGRIRPLIPDSRESEVRLQGTVRTNANGERLVTLFLVNGQLEPETNRDSAWLFQPEILVRGRDDSDRQVFRRRPASDVVVDDAERDHLGLIYRRRVEFGRASCRERVLVTV